MPLPRSIQLGLVLLPLAAGMVALGCWQLQRMEQKTALVSEFEQAPERDMATAIAEPTRYATVRVEGQFDTRRHVLLDNMVYRGQAGVHAFTPFTTGDKVTILVNRGWLPLAPDRSTLPAVPTPAGKVTIDAILAPPPEHRQRLGEPDKLGTAQWPQLVTYLDIPAVSQALGVELPQRVLWLDANAPAGFEDRDWSPASMSPQRHRAYAVQWFGLAAAAIVIWCVLLLRGRPASKGAKRQ